jgi:hypothetical protein
MISVPTHRRGLRLLSAGPSSDSGWCSTLVAASRPAPLGGCSRPAQGKRLAKQDEALRGTRGRRLERTEMRASRGPDRERLDGRCQRRLRRGYSASRMNWDLRHRKSSLVIRLVLAVWIAVIVVVLCYSGRWWGLVFVVPLVFDLYLLRRILVAGSSR